MTAPTRTDDASAALVAELLLATPAQARDVFSVLRLSDIHGAELRSVAEAVQDVLERDNALDVVLVRDELLRRNGRPQAEIRDLLGRLLPLAVCAPNIRLHAKVVAREAADVARADAALRLAAAREPQDKALARSQLEAAEARLAQIEAWEDPAADKPPPPPSSWDLTEILASPPPDPPEELVERILTRPSVNIVCGPPSSGKSWALMQTLLDLVLGGGPFLGCPDIAIFPRRDDTGVPTDRVLWVFGSEDTERRIRHRLRTIVEAQGRLEQPIPPGTFVAASPPAGIALGTPQGDAWLAEILDRLQPSQLVLDTVASLTTLDSSKAEDVVPFVRSLHRLRDSRGLCVHVVHHTRKEGQDARKSHGARADSMLGSQAWRSMADAVLILNATDGDATDVRVHLVKSKDLDQPAPPFHVCLQAGLFRFLRWADDEAPEPAPKPGKKTKVQASDVLRLLDDNPNGIHWNSVYTLIRVSRAAWYSHRARILGELAGRARLDGDTLLPA